MRSLFGFLAVALISTTALFAQLRSSGSSSSSSGSSSSSSSSSNSSYSPPSYSPPASSGSSRNDGGSRSSDPSPRSSSSSSSSGGGNYSPPSRGSSEPNSRGSSTNASGSPYHSNSTNNSSGYSNSGDARNSRNAPQVQNRHELPTSVPSKEPASTTLRGTEQPGSHGSTIPGTRRADVNWVNTRQTPSTTSRMPYDPELLNKYSPKQAKIVEQQSKLDEERHKIYTKYKLAGKDSEYEHKLAKLDEKRNKLLEKEARLARSYQLEAERKTPKPCRGNNCPASCPTGTVFTRKGCVPTPPVTPDPQCVKPGYYWDGRQCTDHAYTSSTQSFGLNCSQRYTELKQQEGSLEHLRQVQASVCAANSMSAECSDYTQQLSIAESAFRQSYQEYARMCL